MVSPVGQHAVTLQEPITGWRFTDGNYTGQVGLQFPGDIVDIKEMVAALAQARKLEPEKAIDAPRGHELVRDDDDVYGSSRWHGPALFQGRSVLRRMSVERRASHTQNWTWHSMQSNQFSNM